VIAALAGMKSSRKKKCTKIHSITTILLYTNTIIVPIHGAEGATGVEEEVMVEEVTFLAKLWSTEFVNHPNLDVEKVIMKTLDKMTADGVIIRHTVSVQPTPDATPVTQRLYKISENSSFS
jgi:hypothetical protein